MANPTRQEILEAHDALGELDATAWRSAEDQDEMQLIDAWKKRILKALPPKPQPTMAEIEWDDDKHLLAEAEHSCWGKVVMLNDDEGICIEVLRKRHGKDVRDYARDNELTPTGRKYELKEINNG